MNVGFDYVDGRQQNEMLGALAASRRHDHAVRCGHQPRDDVAAHEAAASEHGYGELSHWVSARSGVDSDAAAVTPAGMTTPSRSLSETYGNPSCAW